jgi:hypothetical protein
MVRLASAIWKWISSACRWFFRDRPITYGITYLGLIFVFGLVYTFAVPDGFYAPYSQHDPDLAADQAALTTTLQAMIVRQYTDPLEQALANTPSGMSAHLPDPKNLQVGTNGDSRQLTVEWRGFSPFVRGRGRYLWPLATLTIQKIVELPGGKTKLQLEVEPTFLVVPRSDVREIGQHFFETMFEGQRGKKEYQLPLEPNEVPIVKSYLLGVEGRTDSFRKNLVRMMYLSAVVQTTLGLGDLLPMTMSARSLVGLQAVLGVIFAGLFVNASSRGRDPSHPIDPPRPDTDAIAPYRTHLRRYTWSVWPPADLRAAARNVRFLGKSRPRVL